MVVDFPHDAAGASGVLGRCVCGCATTEAGPGPSQRLPGSSQLAGAGEASPGFNIGVVLSVNGLHAVCWGCLLEMFVWALFAGCAGRYTLRSGRQVAELWLKP